MAAASSTLTGTNGATKNDEEITQEMITELALGNGPLIQESGLFPNTFAMTNRAPVFAEVEHVYISDQGQVGFGLNGSMYTVTSNPVQGNTTAVHTG